MNYFLGRTVHPDGDVFEMSIGDVIPLPIDFTALPGLPDPGNFRA